MEPLVIAAVLVSSVTAVVVIKKHKAKAGDTQSYIDKTKYAARTLSTYYNEDTDEHESLCLLIQAIIDIQRSGTPKKSIDKALEEKVLTLPAVLKKIKVGHSPHEEDIKTQIIEVCLLLTNNLNGIAMTDKEVKENLTRR